VSEIAFRDTLWYKLLFKMKRKRYLTLFFIAAIFLSSGASGIADETRPIRGQSASPAFNESGDLVLLYKNPQGSLSLGQQDSSRIKYAIQEVTTATNVSAPLIKKDRSGKLWASWEREEQNNNVIVFSGMGERDVFSPVSVSSEEGYNFAPDFCFDYGNNPWFSWIHYSEGQYKLLVKEVRTSSTWCFNTPFFSGVHQPKITIDASGKIWVFWSGSVNGRETILTSSFEGGLWTAPTPINKESGAPHILPDVSLDANGFPWITWCSFDGDDYEIYYSFWDGFKWSGQERVTENSDSDVHPHLSFTPGGTPIFVWSKSNGVQNTLSCRLKQAGSWSREIEFPHSEVETSWPPKIVTHKNDVALVWQSGHEIHTRVLHLDELVRMSSAQSEKTQVKKTSEYVLDRDKYIGFGDSITFGMIDYEETPELGYIPRLETMLFETYGQSQVINEGWPGEVTQQGLARISAVLENHKAQYFLLMEGTNDVVFRNISMDTTAYNLEQMIETCRSKRVFPVLATIIPRNDHRWGKEFFRERIFELNDKIRDLAERIDASFIDMFDIYFYWPKEDGGWTSLLSNDYVHPNRKGYQVMAKSWLDEIQRFPFPADGFWVARHHDQVGDFVREANSLMWQDSHKIQDKTDFKSYNIYRKKISEDPSPVKLLKVLLIQTPEASTSGVISFPNFDNFKRRYLDVNIEYLQNYKYTVTLVRKDGVEGPPSSIGQDTAQGGSEN
jgi:lysophospholipase L1-like esterase